jgi:FtsP/CotA-like multicopper oxidase with cupredoxin domain
MHLDFDERAGFLIDQTPYRLDEIAFPVARGAREIWEVRNSPISMPHPMHVHGFGFRVLRRQGTFGPARRLASESSGRLPTDLGIKDTGVIERTIPSPFITRETHHPSLITHHGIWGCSASLRGPKIKGRFPARADAACAYKVA